ncbi:MAG: hypothetical protein K2N71_07675 [Oscillospiraceae bacterium]|nr:hypothetical protein [Oscillospiraceae bacterium]
MIPPKFIRKSSNLYEPHYPLTRGTSVLYQTAAHGCPWQNSRTDAFSKQIYSAYVLSLERKKCYSPGHSL